MTGAPQAAQEEWGRRVVAEYCSSLMTQEFTLRLMRLGAPPDLVRDGMRIAEEELNHAELSLEVYQACGGQEMPAVDTEAAALPEGDPIASVLLSTLRIFCLGETVAVPLFANLRRGCSEELPSAVFDVILKDEVGHRQFGWDVLDWLMLAAGEETIINLAHELLPELLAGVQRNYGAGVDDPPEWPDELRAWGLAPPHEYAAILAATFEKEYVPRFSARGIDISGLQLSDLHSSTSSV